MLEETSSSSSSEEDNYPTVVGDRISITDLLSALGGGMPDGSPPRRFFTPPRVAVPYDYFRNCVSTLDENENLYWGPHSGNSKWEHIRRVQAVDTVQHHPQVRPESYRSVIRFSVE
jgi:hypothetical protein